MTALLPTLLLLAVLYALASLFCCIETAFTSVNRTLIQNLAARGDRRAQLAARLLDSAGEFFGTVLLGTNLIHVTITTLVRSTVVLAIVRTDAFQALLAFWQRGGSGGEDILTSLLVTPTLLLFTEMVPKAIGRNHADTLSLALARPLDWARRALRLPVIVLDRISGAVARAVCQSQKLPARGQVTREDLKILAEVAMEQGLVRKEAGNMLQTVLELDTKPIETVMVPLVDVQSVPLTASVADVEALAAQTGFSRFPVYDGRVDEVIGIVSLRQCLYEQLPSEDQDQEKRASLGIAQFVNTQVLFVPESKSVSALLDELRYQHIPMAVVVDEHGGVVGIITVEDLVAQIVGGIHDARNQESAMVKPLAEGGFECDGKADVREIEDYMGLEIDNQVFETAAGLVLKIAGRIPRVHEHFSYAHFDIEVLAVRRHRVMKLRFQNKTLFRDCRGAGSGPGAAVKQVAGGERHDDGSTGVVE